MPEDRHEPSARGMAARPTSSPQISLLEQAEPEQRDSRDSHGSTDFDRTQALSRLLEAARAFADDLAGRPDEGDTEAPLQEVRRMGELGLLTAPLPASYGGLGLGTEAGGHLTLLRVLAAIGGGDLVLGRLYEGHVNALVLIVSFGDATQIQAAADDAEDGKLFGVWNTGAPELLRIEVGLDRYTLRGVKTFASGAGFVERPIVTAETAERGWQMTLPRMEATDVREHIQLDRGFWQPLGMEASGSFGIDFTGAQLTKDDLIGFPGDFYRDPLFRGGAIRFAAVQAGAIQRLHGLFTEWLGQRAEDPYQVARLGELALLTQQAVLWIERAASVAEDGLSIASDKLAADRMVMFANMARLAIERNATAAIQHVISGVGARGLLRPNRFGRIVRDLTMYLRQPAPDQTLADVGRASLRAIRLWPDDAAHSGWHTGGSKGSLPPAYFNRMYEGSTDPWNFETSEYEAGKYRTTLARLPKDRYRKALEIGCSIGVLTQQLASRCDALLSLDVSEHALAVARKRCAELSHVHFERMQVPDEMPEGCFDLIVISEVAYYWKSQDLDRAAAKLAALQPEGGDLILVHFTGPVPDYPLTGDQVHDLWTARPEWTVLQQERCEGYRLAVLRRCGHGPRMAADSADEVAGKMAAAAIGE